MQKENTNPSPEIHQYVGPYRLEKTLGKGQTGEFPPAPFPYFSPRSTSPLIFNYLKDTTPTNNIPYSLLPPLSFLLDLAFPSTTTPPYPPKQKNPKN
jgi:hypothetical protein